MNLCHRCGAIIENDHPTGSFSGQCPACGLGYSGTSFTLSHTEKSPSKAGAVVSKEEQAFKVKRDADRRDAVTRCPFPIYGLDQGWTGRRWVGGWGTSGSGISHLELAHGDVYDPDAPLVRLNTRPTSAEPEPDINTYKPLVWHWEAQSLVEYLWHDTGVYLDATPSTFRSEDPTGEWDTTALTVDGKSTDFSSLGVGEKWVALGEVGNAVLGLQVRNLAPTDVRLVTITNAMEYLGDDGGPQ